MSKPCAASARSAYELGLTALLFFHRKAVAENVETFVPEGGIGGTADSSGDRILCVKVSS